MMHIYARRRAYGCSCGGTYTLAGPQRATEGVEQQSLLTQKNKCKQQQLNMHSYCIYCAHVSTHKHSTCTALYIVLPVRNQML